MVRSRISPRRLAFIAAPFLVAMLVVLAGCSGGSGRNRPTIGDVVPTPTTGNGSHDSGQRIGGSVVTVGFRSQTVHVHSGLGVLVEDRHFSPGIGDSWSVVQRPDPAVAKVTRGKVSDCNQPGCTGRFDYVVEAVGRGTTTVQFQYCYRSDPGPECLGRGGEPTPAPVVLTVVVS